MESAMYFRWGKPVAGHEREALALFAETVEFLTELREKGWITSFEPFMFETSDFEEAAGFWVVKGPEEELARIRHEERFITLNTKAAIFLKHYTVAILRVGEGFTEQMDHLGKIYAEIGV